MATAQAISSREAWNSRAVELAWARHLINTERHLGAGDEDEEMFIVRSDSNPAEPHVVRVYAGMRAVCDCRAGAVGRACGHAGAALHWCEQRDGVSHLRHTFDEASRQTWLLACGWK